MTLKALRLCGHAWSVDFAREVLSRVHRHLSSYKASEWQLSWQLQTELVRFAYHVPPSLLIELEVAWSRQFSDRSGRAKSAKEFLSVLRFRRDMLEAIKKDDGLERVNSLHFC